MASPPRSGSPAPSGRRDHREPVVVWRHRVRDGDEDLRARNGDPRRAHVVAGPEDALRPLERRGRGLAVAAAAPAPAHPRACGEEEGHQRHDRRAHTREHTRAADWRMLRGAMRPAALTTRLAPVLALLLALPACGGDDGPGAHPIDVDLALQGEPPGGAVVTAAWVSLGAPGVRLMRADACDGAPELGVPGPLAMDLFVDGPPPQLAQVTVAETGYCAARVAFAPWTGATPVGAPPVLEGASIVLIGLRQDGVYFVIRSAFAGDIAATAGGGTYHVNAATPLMVINIDLPVLLAGVDLAPLAAGPDGKIHIEPGVNQAALDVFDANLAQALSLQGVQL
jgi:hypothetical protein